MKVLNKGEIKEQKWKLRNILLAITSCNLNKYMYSLHKEKLQQWGDVYQNWFLSKRSSKSRKPFLQYVTLHSCITIIRKKKKKQRNMSSREVESLPKATVNNIIIILCINSYKTWFFAVRDHGKFNTKLFTWYS